MDNAQIVRFETLRSLAFGSISGTYAAVGTALIHSARVIGIDNTTDADMLVSFDGVNNHTILIAHSGKIFDFTSNRAEPVGNLELPNHTAVYVKQVSAPSMGSVYVTSLYGSTT